MWTPHGCDAVCSFPMKGATTKWMESIMGQVDNIEKWRVAVEILNMKAKSCLEVLQITMTSRTPKLTMH